MYAIVDILGEQVKVSKGEEVAVPFMSESKEGDALTLDKVLLISGDGEPVVGQPTISGAAVRAKVLGHFKGDKVIVFKKKRRTGYHKTQGHRQNYTKILVEEIKA
jgi:large subunit ribosomal protein L21